VGGRRRTRREPTLPRGEHANTTQKDRPDREPYPWPSCCEATVLATTPSCSPHLRSNTTNHQPPHLFFLFLFINSFFTSSSYVLWLHLLYFFRTNLTAEENPGPCPPLHQAHKAHVKHPPTSRTPGSDATVVLRRSLEKHG